MTKLLIDRLELYFRAFLLMCNEFSYFSHLSNIHSSIHVSFFVATHFLDHLVCDCEHWRWRVWLVSHVDCQSKLMAEPFQWRLICECLRFAEFWNKKISNFLSVVTHSWGSICTHLLHVCSWILKPNLLIPIRLWTRPLEGQQLLLLIHEKTWKSLKITCPNLLT